VGLLGEMPSVRSAAERRIRFGQASLQERYNEDIQQAGKVRTCDLAYMPRVLQTLEYAKAALADQSRAQTSVEDLDAAAANVVKSAPLMADPRRRFELLVVETALRWQIGSVAVMRAQLAHLHTAFDRTNVQLRVLPLDRPLRLLPRLSFALYDYVGYVDSFWSPEKITGDRWARYSTVMDLLWGEALEGGDACDRISLAMDALPRT
jgi:hypothetical protein